MTLVDHDILYCQVKFETLGFEWEKSKKVHFPVAIVFCDMDHLLALGKDRLR